MNEMTMTGVAFADIPMTSHRPTPWYLSEFTAPLVACLLLAFVRWLLGYEHPVRGER